MTKKKTNANSLRDLVMSKSQKFIDKAKLPWKKKQVKNEFESMINGYVSDIIDSKNTILELVTNVKELDIEPIVEQMEFIESAKSTIDKICTIYKLLFNEELEVDLTDEDVEVNVNDLLGKADEIEEEKDD